MEILDQAIKQEKQSSAQVTDIGNRVSIQSIEEVKRSSIQRNTEAVEIMLIFPPCIYCIFKVLVLTNLT